MSGWPSGHQPRKRGCSWMSFVAYGSRLEHRTEDAVLAGEAERGDQLVAHPGGEEAAEAAGAVRGQAPRTAPGEPAGALDEPLQDLVDRVLGGDAEDRLADLRRVCSFTASALHAARPCAGGARGLHSPRS